MGQRVDIYEQRGDAEFLLQQSCDARGSRPLQCRKCHWWRRRVKCGLRRSGKNRFKTGLFSPLKSHECGFIDYLPEDFERPRPPCSHTLHQTQWNHLCLTEHTNTQFTLISFQQRERKLCIQTEKCNQKCDKKKIVQGSVRGEVRQALSMSHQNQKTDSYATDNNRAHDSLLLC